MKPFIALLLTVAACCGQSTFIRGTLDIKYNTRTSPGDGVVDVYSMNINVCDSAVFKGTIDFLPYIAGTFSDQQARLNYNLESSVVNPANTAETRAVGRIYGTVPILPNGLYKYGEGSLKVSIEAIGRAEAFESKFTGTAQGKPLIKVAQATGAKITRVVNGKTVTINVDKYDKMVFTDHKFGKGPVGKYPECTVNGSMIYDYERSVWYFKDVQMAYATNGTPRVDKLTGNIRWIESRSEYEFDVRLNEPPPGEEGVFAAASDEASFFQVDQSLCALTGTMKYKDTKTGERASASNVTINLIGSKLSQVQTMNLAKLILISAIVPINSD